MRMSLVVLALALASGLFPSLWSASCTDAGLGMDPNGGCRPEGLGMDPNGAPQSDEGLGMDPSGRSAPQADEGLIMDPNG